MAEPVSLEGGLGERPGLAEAVVGPGRTKRRTRPPSSVSDGQARGRAADRVLDCAPARASRDDLQARWLGTDKRVAPVVPPAGAEVVPAGPADRGAGLSGVSAVTVPTVGRSIPPSPRPRQTRQGVQADGPRRPGGCVRRPGSRFDGVNSGGGG